MEGVVERSEIVNAPQSFIETINVLTWLILPNLSSPIIDAIAIGAGKSVYPVLKSWAVFVQYPKGYNRCLLLIHDH